MLLAVLELAGVINPVYSENGGSSAGTVSAGYQNFIICIEMLFAAVAMWFAFPHKIYIHTKSPTTGTTAAKGVSLQSISSNLRETINPKDIMADAIHNFHPQYQEYTQQV
jgi:Organic solute transporter Ostalpha